MRSVVATVALAAVLGLVACGGDGGSTGSTGEASAGKVRDVGLVTAYCLYRSDTKAQMLNCEGETEAAQVQSTDDEAARWARGELQTCGKDAGELCQYYRGTGESQVGSEAP